MTVSVGTALEPQGWAAEAVPLGTLGRRLVAGRGELAEFVELTSNVPVEQFFGHVDGVQLDRAGL